MEPEVHLELREIYRDHLDQDDITVQMVSVECENFRLFFDKDRAELFAYQIDAASFSIPNTYLLVESYDGEAFFVRREDENLVALACPDLDRYTCPWGPLRDAVLEVTHSD